MVASTTHILAKALAHRVKHTVTATTLRPAAVLVLVYPKDGECCILLNKRSDQVEYHKGEISFPGGAWDPQDRDYLDTALRETQEEMGINAADVTVLGQLDDVATQSRFAVQVYVGTMSYPCAFQPSADEIAEVLEVPISALRDPASRCLETRWVDGECVTTYCYTYNDHLIFGATAKILEQLLELLGTG